MSDIQEDGPETDGCELDFTEDEDDDETAALRPLFPDGNSDKEQEWRDLFTDSGSPEDVTSEGA